MTALAAVIALSSTPLFAQTSDLPETTAPATEPAPAPVAADPIAPTAADPLAPETAVTPARKATATKATTARSRPAAPAKTTTARTADAAPAAAAAAPIAEPPVEQPLPTQMETAIAPVVTPVDQPAPAADLMSSDALPIAGAAGLGIVLLAGAGLAVRRRKRRAQEAEDAAWQHDVETAADPAAEPAMAAEPALELTEPAFVAASAPAAEAAPAMEDAPVTELPEGFDLSRFGFNVQQAYKGPTPDNPSLSLKHRLRRASGMDQQERKLEAEVEAVTGESPLAEPDPVEAPAAKPAFANQAKGDFMFARDRTKPKTSPAYSN